MAGRNEVGITLTARDIASREINRVGGSLRGLGDETDRTTKKTSLLGRIAGGVFEGVFLGAGIYAFGKVRESFGFIKDATIGFNQQMAQASIAFTTMLGSGEKAAAFLDDLKDFAAKTPFEFPDLLSASQRLLAMGFAAQDVVPMMSAIGDAAAGLGGAPETIMRITNALGQMSAKGRVSGEEMLQLTEQGIPAWQYLADSIGKSTAETMKLAEKGLIPADQAIRALTKGMEENFGGLMDTQAHTFSGAMSTIKDVTRSTMATAFKPLFDLLTKGADALSTFLQTGDFVAWSERFAAGLQRAIDKAMEFGGVLLAFPRYFGAVREDGDTMNDWLTHMPESIRGVVEALGGLSIGTQSWGDVFGEIEDAARSFISKINFKKITDQIIDFGESLAEGIDVGAIVDGFLELREEVGAAIVGIVNEAIPLLLDGINTLAAELPGILSMVLPVILDSVARWAEGFMTFVSNGVDMLSAHWPQIIETISGLFQSIFDWIINIGIPMAATALAQFAAKFIDWFFEVAPKVLDMLDELIGAILGFIVKNGPILAGKLVEWGVAFVGWIVTVAIPKLVANLPTILRILLLFLGGAAVKLLAKAGSMGAGFIKHIIDWIAQLPGRFASWLQQTLLRVATWIGQMLARGTQGGRDFVGKIVSFIQQLPGKFAQWLGDIVRKVIGWGADLARGALRAGGDFVGGFIRGIASLPGKVADKIRSAFANLRIDIGPFHITGRGITIDLPKIELPSFAVGAWKLPTDMIAAVHKGEMIIPADIAARLRGETGGPRPGQSAPSIASVTNGGSVVVQISNYYGPSSVRSSEDIRRISEEQAENIRLMGFTPTIRTAGSLG